MLRVNILDNGVVRQTAHLKDDIQAARRWARSTLFLAGRLDGTHRYEAGRFATIYRCEDEQSSSVEFLGEVGVSLCEGCRFNAGIALKNIYVCAFGNYPGAKKSRCKYHEGR